jgi:retron-type reverse transcriptase
LENKVKIKTKKLIPKLIDSMQQGENPMNNYSSEIRALIIQKQYLLCYSADTFGRKSNNTYKLVNNFICSLEFRVFAVEKMRCSLGARTSGSDCQILTTNNILDFINKLSYKQLMSYRASPLKRVFIPKDTGGQRLIWIPTIFDRLVQTLFILIYEPIIDSNSDKYSFGFRCGRHAHQAIGALASKLSYRFDKKLSFNDPKYIMKFSIKDFFGSEACC